MAILTDAYFRLITDDVPANHTIWVLGDSLLTEAAGHYNFFKKRKDLSLPTSQQQLYMETMYAIRLISPGIYTAKQAKNVPNIILNHLVDTLNVKAKVPHTLIIMINDYRFWNDSNLLASQMERIIARFIKEIRRIAEARNNSLPPRAVNWNYPRIFITKALPLPNNMCKPYPKGFKANRRKFNKLLLRGEQENAYKTINLPDFTCENENNLFHKDGSITKAGYRAVWLSVSDAIHKADNQDRINMNKAKAKQISSQIILTNDELKNEQNDGDISDIESLDDDTAFIPRKPSTAKRALIDEFDAVTQKRHHSGRDRTDWHSNERGDHYPTTNRHQGHQGHQLQHLLKRKRQQKNNWRNPNK